MIENKLLQIIDANLNRAREGLRVCEDIARFSLRNKNATKTLKAIRHGATDLVLKSKKISFRALLSKRDIAKDKTKFVDFTPGAGIEISVIFMSNIQRVKESLRVLEECFKTGLRIKSLLKNKALFIINDRVCMALALDADGVHLGSMDAGRDSQKDPWQEKDNRMLSRFPGGGPEGAKTGRRLYCHRRYF